MAARVEMQKALCDDDTNGTAMRRAVDEEMASLIDAAFRSLDERVESLEQRVDRYHTIFSEAPIAMALVDASGVVLEVNPWYLRLTGRSPNGSGALVGKSLLADPAVERLGLRDLVVKLLEGEPVERRRQHAKTSAEEGQLAVNVRGLPIRGLAGEMTGAIVLLEDVTEEARLGDQLVRAQKMESLGTLAGGIAHEFNNLLSGILGHASMLHAKLPPESPLLRYATRVEESAQRAAELTQQLLSFSREADVERHPVNVAHLLSELGRLVDRAFSSTVRVTVDCQDPDATIDADRTQIQQALLNVCVNARDAMAHGGDLALRMLATGQRPASATEGSATGGWVRIDVVDTGTGMDAGTLAQVFDPFFTTKPPGRGTGLGLAIAYRIIEAHGGCVELTSSPGAGTTVSFFLPRSASKEAEAPAMLPAAPRGKGTILVVDDEPVLLELVSELLGELGYEILMAEDGLEAIDIYEMRWTSIDLVLLDVVMPRMGGRETLNALRSVNPTVNVIVCSGYLHESDVEGLLLKDVKGFLRKPYDRERLAHAVWRALGSSAQ
jgi:PAS domain S-box-containing protein